MRIETSEIECNLIYGPYFAEEDGKILADFLKKQGRIIEEVEVASDGVKLVIGVLNKYRIPSFLEKIKSGIA